MVSVKTYLPTAKQIKAAISTPSNGKGREGVYTKIPNSKLFWASLAEVPELDNLYLIVSANLPLLEVRFALGGPASNDRYYLINQAKLPDWKRRAASLKRVLKARFPVLKFKRYQSYLSVQDLPLFIEVYKQTRIKPVDVNEKLLEIYNDSNTAFHSGNSESKLTDTQFDDLRIYLSSNGLIDGDTKVKLDIPKSRKVELKTPLGSLENAFDQNALKLWSKAYPNEDLILTPKIDGISAQINYVKGVLQSANTKGDGYTGEDITELVKAVPDVPKKLKRAVTVSIRCELFMQDTVFAEKYGRDSGRDKPFANPRNLVAGIKNRKTVDQEIAKDISVLGYAILGSTEDKRDQLETLQRGLGFPTVKFVQIKAKELAKTDKVFEDYLKQDFQQDGLVVEVNNAKKRTGYTNGINPKYSIAYKPRESIVEVRVVRVEWNVSKDRYLKPTVYVEAI